MAYSKLFSGDLPEISTQIIQNLRNDVNTLYFLALENRFWCRLAIPLLFFLPNIEKIQPFIFLIHISSSEKFFRRKVTQGYTSIVRLHKNV